MGWMVSFGEGWRERGGGHTGDDEQRGEFERHCGREVVVVFALEGECVVCAAVLWVRRRRARARARAESRAKRPGRGGVRQLRISGIRIPRV
jgi:hypothetical protein